MTREEAVNWLINIMSDIGKAQHRDLWHYEQAVAEIKKMLEEEPQWIPCSDCERRCKKWEHSKTLQE